MATRPAIGMMKPKLPPMIFFPAPFGDPVGVGAAEVSLTMEVSAGVAVVRIFWLPVTLLIRDETSEATEVAEATTDFRTSEISLPPYSEQMADAAAMIPGIWEGWHLALTQSMTALRASVSAH